jgi:hypothetical protein
VEHILDKANSVLPNASKGVVGNLVMAYGKWNQELGQLNWTNVEREKREIYGDWLVDQALLNVEWCGDHLEEEGGEEGGWWSFSFSLNLDWWTGSDISTKVGLGLGIPVLVTLLILVGLALKYGKVVHQHWPIEVAALPSSSSEDKGDEEGLTISEN